MRLKRILFPAIWTIFHYFTVLVIYDMSGRLNKTIACVDFIFYFNFIHFVWLLNNLAIWSTVIFGKVYFIPSPVDCKQKFSLKILFAASSSWHQTFIWHFSFGKVMSRTILATQSWLISGQDNWTTSSRTKSTIYQIYSDLHVVNRQICVCVCFNHNQPFSFKMNNTHT